MKNLFAFMLLAVAWSFWCGSMAFAGNDHSDDAPSSAVAEKGPATSAGIDPKNLIPFKLVRGHLIVVKCSVGGLRDLTAIVDTGASETVVDMALVRKLSLAIAPDSATFIAQQAKVWAVSIPGLQLGPISVDRLEGIAADLSSLTAELGIRPQVLIGMDILQRSSFLIDYQSHRLVFDSIGSALPLDHLPHSAPLVSLASDGASERPRAPAVSGNSAMSAHGRFAVIEATVAGRALRLQVDSGFEGLLVYGGRPAAAAIAGREARLANLGETLLARSSVPPNVEIGGWRAPYAHLTVVEGPPPESAEFDGLIGTAVLSKKKVAFDFQNGRIFWE